VQLGLSSACANGAEGDQVSKELWGDGIQHFAGNWHSGAGQVAEELARNTEALVDLVSLIDIRIVDQSLPSDGRTWLLEVGAHDDAEVIRELVSDSLEARAVLEGGGWVVDGAGTADDEQAVVGSHDDVDGIFAALDDGLQGRLGEWDLGEEQLRWDQWILAED